VSISLEWLTSTAHRPHLSCSSC